MLCFSALKTLVRLFYCVGEMGVFVDGIVQQAHAARARCSYPPVASTGIQWGCRFWGVQKVIIGEHAARALVWISPPPWPRNGFRWSVQRAAAKDTSCGCVAAGTIAGEPLASSGAGSPGRVSFCGLRIGACERAGSSPLAEHPRECGHWRLHRG